MRNITRHAWDAVHLAKKSILRDGLCLVLFAPIALAQPAFVPRPSLAPPPPEGLAAFLLAMQASFHRAMTGLLASNEGLAMLALLAFAYGVFHAVGPGHGKAVIASYLIANENAVRRGIALAFAAALVQALIALGMVLIVIGLMQATPIQLETQIRYIEMTGFGLVAVMGLVLGGRKVRQAFLTAPETCLEKGCAHILAPQGATGLRDFWVMALAAGLRPCSGAIIVLVFALAKGFYLAGFLAVAAMALGTACGTSVFALLASKAKHLALYLLEGRRGSVRWLLALEALAAFALAAFGFALAAGAMRAEF